MATPTYFGGYEYDFIKNPPDELICKICHHPCREPYLSGCCGHNFCKSCVDATKRTTANCPLCRNAKFATFANKLSDRKIRSLHVVCTNKERGCEWQGELNDIINHLGSGLNSCQFQMIQCEYHNVGCEERMMRKDLETHKKEKMENHLLLTSSQLAKAMKHIDTLMIALNPSIPQTYNTARVRSSGSLISEARRSLNLTTMVAMAKSDRVCPVVISVTEFHKKKKAKVEWYSNSFYSHDRGYKMCLSIDPAGIDEGKGTHLSLFLFLMKGPHDDELTWPLRGKFEVKLLNQISDCEHDITTLTYGDHIPERYTRRVTDGDRASCGWGWTTFFSHERLHKVTPTSQYLKDDCIFLQVSKL